MFAGAMRRLRAHGDDVGEPGLLRLAAQPRDRDEVLHRHRAARRSGRRAPRRTASIWPSFAAGAARRRRASGTPRGAGARSRRSPRGCARRPAARAAARSGPRRRRRGTPTRPRRSCAGRGRSRRPAMWPDCSPPSRLPAPRISRSFSAICMPPPSSLFAAIVVEPVVRGLAERLLVVVEEVGVRALAAAADATAHLVQLRQAVLVGAVDDDACSRWRCRGRSR